MFCKVCSKEKPNSKGGSKATTCTDCLSNGFKYCNACGEVKQLFDFGTDTLGRPRSSCKQCQAKHSAKHKKIKYATDEEYRVKRLAQNHERRTKVKGSYTPDEWHNKAAQYNFSCAYCGRTTNITCDHVIALSAGGSNEISNIVPACSTCNYSKGAKDVIEWYASQAFFSKERLLKIIGGEIDAER